MMPGTMAPRARAASSKGRGITWAAEQQLAHRLIIMASALRALTRESNPAMPSFKQAAGRLMEAARLAPQIADLEDGALLQHLVWLAMTRLCREPVESLHVQGTRVVIDRPSADAPWTLVLVPLPRSVCARANAALYPGATRIGGHDNVAVHDAFDCRVDEAEAVFQHLKADRLGLADRGDIHSYYAVAHAGDVPTHAVVRTTMALERERKASATADHAVWKMLPHRLGELSALRELIDILSPPPAEVRPVTLDDVQLDHAGRTGGFVQLAVDALQRGVDVFAPFASWDEALQEPLPGTPGEHFAGHAGQTVGRIPRAVLARVRQWLVNLPPDRQHAHARLASAVWFATLTHRLADPMNRRKDVTS